MAPRIRGDHRGGRHADVVVREPAAQLHAGLRRRRKSADHRAARYGAGRLRRRSATCVERHRETGRHGTRRKREAARVTPRIIQHPAHAILVSGRDADSRQRGTISERILPDALHAMRNRYAGKLVTLVKHLLTNARHACGDRQVRQRCTPPERSISDVFRARHRHARQMLTSVKRIIRDARHA